MPRSKRPNRTPSSRACGRRSKRRSGSACSGRRASRPPTVNCSGATTGWSGRCCGRGAPRAVAALSMSAALVFGEELAAVVVALMYAGGQYLESFAEGRARREMTALLARAPRTAVRYRDGAVEEVGINAIAAGDRLLIRRGDVVPVDGQVTSSSAVLDEFGLNWRVDSGSTQSG